MSVGATEKKIKVFAALGRLSADGNLNRSAQGLGGAGRSPSGFQESCLRKLYTVYVCLKRESSSWV